MLRSGASVPRFCRWGALGLAALLAASAVAGAADAKTRRHHRHTQPAAESYQPSYASIVVDANSGAVMQQVNADSPRHPASLTKIMTLYLLFERLEAGKIKLNTEMSVSPHAAAQAPSKLGLKPGETIAVETAIRAIVTKSANDVAVIVAEALGGSEEDFAKLMTAKAHALGMTHTNYRNASGLPDEQQITTARDMAVLGRAIQDRFPEYYKYFSTRYFEFRGRMVRNHNHLLGNIPGVDGIKTGYIHESGFNIVTSVRRNNRHIVAVVFGGHTAEARDARMRSLIDNNINIASAKRTAPPVIEGWDVAAAAHAKEPERAKENNKEKPATEAKAEAGPAVGSTEPIKPNAVKTFVVQPGAVHTAALSPLPSASRRLMPVPAAARSASITTVTTVKSEPTMPPLAPAAAAETQPKPTEVASAGAVVPVAASAAQAKSRAGASWVIQVGAFDSQTEAIERLSTVQNGAKALLAEAIPLTERVEKGDKTMYRARFTGLEKDQAETACKNLKRSDIPCMLLKN
jgi:D-alanyl-D-alanine carboxypeptidase